MTRAQAVLEMLERGGWMSIAPEEREIVAELIEEVIVEKS